MYVIYWCHNVSPGHGGRGSEACGGGGEAIYGQAGTGFQVTHIKREKSPSTRTGHRCSHFAVHCNVVGSNDDRFSYLMRRTRGIQIHRC
jgi:hypothetical protein